MHYRSTLSMSISIDIDNVEPISIIFCIGLLFPLRLVLLRDSITVNQESWCLSANNNLWTVLMKNIVPMPAAVVRRRGRLATLPLMEALTRMNHIRMKPL